VLGLQLLLTLTLPSALVCERFHRHGSANKQNLSNPLLNSQLKYVLELYKPIKSGYATAVALVAERYKTSRKICHGAQVSGTNIDVVLTQFKCKLQTSHLGTFPKQCNVEQLECKPDWCTLAPPISAALSPLLPTAHMQACIAKQMSASETQHTAPDGLPGCHTMPLSLQHWLSGLCCAPLL
jgi:hypothetical protein